MFLDDKFKEYVALVEQKNVTKAMQLWDEEFITMRTLTRPHQSVLHRAATFDVAELIPFFIEKGMDVDFPDLWSKNTALHIAAEYGHHDVVTALVQCGANVYALNYSGWTPLNNAQIYEHRRCVGIMMRARTKCTKMVGADVKQHEWLDTTRYSAFTLEVLRKREALKVYCYGDGLIRAYLNKINSFRVDATETEFNILYVVASGPRFQCEVTVKCIDFNQFVVNYKIQENGPHYLIVKWGDNHVLGSPFIFDVSERKTFGDFIDFSEW